MLMRTTPFPAVDGSQTEKTDDRYYCNECLHVGYADHMESTGAITCEDCDSEDVVLERVRARQIRAEIDAALAQADREADERALHGDGK
jgi:hypothetical protein